MRLRNDIADRTMYQCADCLNYYLKDSQNAPHDCPRDKTTLYESTTKAAAELLDYFKVICEGCGCLRLLDRARLNPCALCGCPEFGQLHQEEETCALEDLSENASKH